MSLRLRRPLGQRPQEGHGREERPPMSRPSIIIGCAEALPPLLSSSSRRTIATRSPRRITSSLLFTSISQTNLPSAPSRLLTAAPRRRSSRLPLSNVTRSLLSDFPTLFPSPPSMVALSSPAPSPILASLRSASSPITRTSGSTSFKSPFQLSSASTGFDGTTLTSIGLATSSLFPAACLKTPLRSPSSVSAPVRYHIQLPLGRRFALSSAPPDQASVYPVRLFLSLLFRISTSTLFHRHQSHLSTLPNPATAAQYQSLRCAACTVPSLLFGLKAPVFKPSSPTSSSRKSPSTSPSPRRVNSARLPRLSQRRSLTSVPVPVKVGPRSRLPPPSARRRSMLFLHPRLRFPRKSLLLRLTSLPTSPTRFPPNTTTSSTCSRTARTKPYLLIALVST